MNYYILSSKGIHNYESFLIINNRFDFNLTVMEKFFEKNCSMIEEWNKLENLKLIKGDPSKKTKVVDFPISMSNLISYKAMLLLSKYSNKVEYLEVKDNEMPYYFVNCFNSFDLNEVDIKNSYLYNGLKTSADLIFSKSCFNEEFKEDVFLLKELME